MLSALGICLILATLNGCASIPKFPAQYVYEVDLKANVCGQYKVVNYEKITLDHVADLPLSACDGVFGFSASTISPVLNWMRDRIVEGKARCR